MAKLKIASLSLQLSLNTCNVDEANTSLDISNAKPKHHIECVKHFSNGGEYIAWSQICYGVVQTTPVVIGYTEQTDLYVWIYMIDIQDDSCKVWRVGSVLI